jgi:hypothetical protein
MLTVTLRVQSRLLVIVLVPFAMLEDYETVSADCDTCRVLLNRLKDCTDRLKAVTSRMHSLAGTERTDEFADALREAESLRMECRTVRDAVERHKTEHDLKESRPNGSA